MLAEPKLSIVIPCRDHDESLAKLLPPLCAASDVEIIVAGDTADPRVAALCAKHDVQHLVLDQARGDRLRAAADAASGPNLWFVHADAQLADGAADAVIDAFNGGFIGGYFRFRLSGAPSFAKRLIEVGVALRCRLGGIPYGDQAPFVTKVAYEAAGGHESLPLFDEFRLLSRLQRLPGFRPLEMAIGVDPKRWDRNGYLRSIVKNRSLSIAYMLGVSPKRLARWYYGRRKRSDAGCAESSRKLSSIAAAIVLLSACANSNQPPWDFWDRSDPASSTRVDHGVWDAFVKAHVVDDGSGINKVRYRSVTSASRHALDGYLKRLSAIDPRALNRREQLAYWINLYNALTVAVVLRYPGRESITDMGDGAPGSGPWRDKRLAIAGQPVSLDDIEHRILRPLWRDRRIHYGLNCASISCPSLVPEAFTAATADGLLDAAERNYVNHERAVSFDATGQLTLSSIYQWYADDFAPSERALLEYLGEVHESEGERLVSYAGAIRYDYDWSLNAKDSELR